MVGGNGPDVTWRLAARFADELNLDGMTPPEVAEALPVIRARCEEIERDPDSLSVSVHTWRESPGVSERRPAARRPLRRVCRAGPVARAVVHRRHGRWARGAGILRGRPARRRSRPPGLSLTVSAVVIGSRVPAARSTGAHPSTPQDGGLETQPARGQVARPPIRLALRRPVLQVVRERAVAEDRRTPSRILKRSGDASGGRTNAGGGGRSAGICLPPRLGRASRRVLGVDVPKDAL